MSRRYFLVDELSGTESEIPGYLYYAIVGSLVGMAVFAFAYLVMLAWIMVTL